MSFRLDFELTSFPLPFQGEPITISLQFHVGFSQIQLRNHFGVHFGFTSIELRFPSVFISIAPVSIRCQFDFASISIRYRLGSTAGSLRFLFTSASLRAFLRLHADFTSISLRIHFDVTPDALGVHCDVASIPFRCHLGFHFNPT